MEQIEILVGELRLKSDQNERYILAKQMTEIKADVKDVKRSQDELMKRVDEVESTPDKKRSRMIDGIVEKIVWLVVGGLATVAVGQMFPFVK